MPRRKFVVIGLVSAVVTLLLPASPQRAGAQASPPRLPLLYVADTVVLEGNAGGTTAAFVLSLTAASATAVTVRAATADGTATAGVDYAAVPTTTVTFAPGETTQTVAVSVNGDLLSEANETFSLKLSSPSGAALGDAAGMATIIDDEGPTAVYVDDPVVPEGGGGTATFTVTLSRAPSSGETVTVKAVTADGSATAGSDYTALPSTTLTFAPGERSKPVPVAVFGDALAEGNETFLLKLSSPSAHTVLADSKGQATILDDERVTAPPRPSLYVTDAVVLEGNVAGATAAFVLSLAPASATAVTVKVATANGTATAGADYVGLPATTVTFAPGEITRTVPVAVTGDVVNEANETFNLQLSSPSGATLGDAAGVATIIDDEGPTAVYVDDPAVPEGSGGGAATFTITLSKAPAEGQTVTVKAATANGSATAGSDYTGLPSTILTFAPGERSKPVTIRLLADTLAEGNETFLLKLSSPSANVVLADNQGQATILDGLGTATLAFRDVTADAGLATLGSAYSHAAAWGDANGDGRLDLFVGTFADKARTDGQPASPNRLFLGTATGGFQDAGQSAVEGRGRAAGAVFVDLDGDGDLDLVVSNNSKSVADPTPETSEPTRIFRNDQGLFVDVTGASGISASYLNGRAVGVLDYNADGRVDLFLVADSLTGSGTRVSRLLRNEGSMTFTDVTAGAGLPTNLAGLGIAVGDANGDGWPDLVMTGGVTGSGSYAGAFLFVNRRDGTFRDATTAALAWTPRGDEDWTAGAAFGDLNGDGRLDLVVTHHFGSAQAQPLPPRIYLNRGNDGAGSPILEELNSAGILPIPSKAPHVEVADFDNDGRLDIYTSVVLDTANGIAPYVYLQQGSNGTGQPAFLSPAGAVRSYAPGGPSADYDGDGRLDVLLEGFDVEIAPSLLRNVSAGGHWLEVKVVAPSNSMGLGAKVSVYRAGQLGQAAGLIQMAEISVGNGFSSAGPAIAHLGLGLDSLVDVAVTLPFGGPTIVEAGVQADRLLTVSP